MSRILPVFIFPLDLLSYLTGNADTSSSIDKSAPTEMGRPRPRNETQVNYDFTKNIKSLFWFSGIMHFLRNRQSQVHWKVWTQMLAQNNRKD